MGKVVVATLGQHKDFLFKARGKSEKAHDRASPGRNSSWQIPHRKSETLPLEPVLLIA
jgi:hypothetical protein